MSDSPLQSMLNQMPGPPSRSYHINFEKTGNHTAFTYEHLVWASFNRSASITLHFASHTVTLTGRNLLELYEDILRHEVSHVRATATSRDVASDDDVPVVNTIVILPTKSKAERFGMGTPVATDSRNDTGGDELFDEQKGAR